MVPVWEPFGRKMSASGERQVGLLVIEYLWDSCALKPEEMELCFGVPVTRESNNLVLDVS